MTTVWVYVDTSKQVGDADHLKVFADPDSANSWFREHDAEGVAFDYGVITQRSPSDSPAAGKASQ